MELKYNLWDGSSAPSTIATGCSIGKLGLWYHLRNTLIPLPIRRSKLHYT